MDHFTCYIERRRNAATGKMKNFMFGDRQETDAEMTLAQQIYTSRDDGLNVTWRCDDEVTWK